MRTSTTPDYVNHLAPPPNDPERPGDFDDDSENELVEDPKSDDEGDFDDDAD